MKKLFLLFSLIVLASCSGAQDLPINPNIPPYRILTTDSNYITPANLKKNTRVMVIYFSPDCPHCQRLTTELKPKMKELGNTQIIMITWSLNYDLRAIKAFYHDYGLAAFPNITIGTEGYTSFVQKYYRVTTTPFIAIYDRSGKMVKSFDKPPKVQDLIAAVKKA
jgi:thioredoxin-related protein